MTRRPLSFLHPVAPATGLLLLCLSCYPLEKPVFQLKPELLQQARKNHGIAAENRLLYWQTLIREHQGSSEKVKLNTVNDFFNGARFVSDIELWKKKDYWATPVEFLIRDAGDCEDYSIAKYFTLKTLGIAPEKLRITYVKSSTHNQAHMVLAYYPTPSAEPLILDNINKRIKPASQRQDLEPVYSFNAENLWLNRSRNESLASGKANQLKAWADLTSRIKQDSLQ